MTKQEIKQQLRNKSGYFNKGKLKKGKSWLAKHYGVALGVIEQVIEELKNEQNAKIKVKDGSNDLPISSKQILEYYDRTGLFIENDKSRLSTNPNSITKAGTYFVTGCVHAPFHNKRMYEATFNYLAKEVPLSGIILAGDIIDANSLSFHDKGNIPIPGVTLDWEYKESNKFLDELEDLTFSSIEQTRIFMYGNHEDRYNRLKRQNDSSKYGEALLSPEEALKLNKRGYDTFTDWKSDVVHIGKHLDINHGEFCNVHTAKKTIDTYRKSTLYFHTHRFQIYMEGMNAGFNMGWGGDINAPVFTYATRAMKSSWVNSSCIVTLDKDGFYHVQPLLFIDNKLIVNGRKY